jgi:hypothetical protein
MARLNYFNIGDHFSEYHRKFDGLAGLDLDFIEICKKCQEPLAMFETAVDKGQTYKTTTVTEKIARACKVPSFLVFYTPGLAHDEVTQFRIKKLTPVESELRVMNPPEFIKMLKILQERHSNDCVLAEVPF